MEFYKKLPRNGKEFIVFLAIVSIISINIIAPLIAGFEAGFSMDAYKGILKGLPLILVAVVILVLLIHGPAEKIAQKITHKDDSFNSQIIVTTLVTVVMMSCCMTIIGSWIGMREISMYPVQNFFYKWPRNFTIAFIVELLIAQPIARQVMVMIHAKKDAQVEEVNTGAN